jgi:peptidoglycan/xylan/chitin deacetylase (PgdA/CDA1 family)
MVRRDSYKVGQRHGPNSLLPDYGACYSRAKLLKQTAKTVLLGLRVPRLAQSLVSPHLVILRYHSVREKLPELDLYMPPGITHTPDAFRSQIEYVAQTCNPVSLDDLPAFIEGSRAFPERAVLVTFDDGFRDNYEVAAPILEEVGLRGVFYVSTSSVEGRPLWIVRLRYWSVKTHKTRAEFLEASGRCASLSESQREEFLASLEGANSVRDNFTMTWEQARHLLQRGHTIGSHTVNHPNVTKIPREELVVEMESSKKALEEHLGAPVRHFSYPNPILEPHWDRTTIEACRVAGYDTAVTSTGGLVRKNANILALPRHYNAESLTDFVWDLEMAFCGSER